MNSFSSAPQGQPLKSECKSTPFPANSKTYAGLFTQKHICFNSHSHLNGRTHYYIIRHAKEACVGKGGGTPGGYTGKAREGTHKTRPDALHYARHGKTQSKMRQNATQNTASYMAKDGISQNGRYAHAKAHAANNAANPSTRHSTYYIYKAWKLTFSFTFILYFAQLTLPLHKASRA